MAPGAGGGGGEGIPLTEIFRDWGYWTLPLPKSTVSTEWEVVVWYKNYWNVSPDWWAERKKVLDLSLSCLADGATTRLSCDGQSRISIVTQRSWGGCVENRSQNEDEERCHMGDLVLARYSSYSGLKRPRVMRWEQHQLLYWADQDLSQAPVQESYDDRSSFENYICVVNG